MKSRRSCVGADIGKSWLRAALHRPPSKKILRARRRISSIAAAADALRPILHSWGLTRADRIVAGATGVWTLGTKRALGRQLAPLARQVVVLPDFELAWQASLGGRPGVLLICGTGSAAYGEDACGHKARSGGLGQLLGDEGSAFWIGKEWLRQRETLALKLAHRPDAIRAVATLAREVLRQARRNAKARSILLRAWTELASLAAQTARKLHFKGPVPIVLSGGMFQDQAFTAGFLRRLRPSRRWRVVSPAMRPEVAAAKFDRISR